MLNAPISWASGLGLFMWLTFTNAGSRQPEWYAIVAGLLGSPIIVLWGQGRREKKDDE